MLEVSDRKLGVGRAHDQVGQGGMESTEGGGTQRRVGVVDKCETEKSGQEEDEDERRAAGAPPSRHQKRRPRGRNRMGAAAERSFPRAEETGRGHRADKSAEGPAEIPSESLHGHLAALITGQPGLRGVWTNCAGRPGAGAGEEKETWAHSRTPHSPSPLAPTRPSPDARSAVFSLLSVTSLRRTMAPIALSALNEPSVEGIAPPAVRKPAYKIASIPADGIGPEVVDAGIAVLKAIAKKRGTFELNFDHLDWSSDRYKQTGSFVL